jgi:hypothetical protein
MSLRTECQTAIYSYCNQECQVDAALTGENKEYVNIVLQLLRDLYKEQNANGDTTFTVPDAVNDFLLAECPW